MNFGNLEKLAAELRKRDDEDFKDGEVLQSILNLGYSKWRENEGWTYDDMVKWVSSEYGEFAALCILLGKYNYQVNNGGHKQYHDNCFTGDVKRGPFGGNESCETPLHDMMVRLFHKFKLHESKLGGKLYGVLCDFVVEEDDFEDDIFGHPVVLGANSLDNRYYEICEEWLEFFGKLVADAIHSVPTSPDQRPAAAVSH